MSALLQTEQQELLHALLEELPEAERSQWELTNALKELSAKWREALEAEKLTG